MLLDETAVLANGNHIPRLGLGTWQIPNDDAPRVVQDVNRRPKRTPYRRPKGTPFVERRDGYDGRFALVAA